MNQADKARRFAKLHVKHSPVVLTNIWDAGSAGAVAKGGALAIATGSWSVAAAQGYPDGEKIPLDGVERTVRQITAAVDLPVSVDFEGGYAVEPDKLAENVERIIDSGAIGINFEDRVVGGEGLHAMDLQCRRIEAIRARADRLGIELFINARTDLFLQAKGDERHEAVHAAAIQRAHAYREAGASGFFAPGLVSEQLIEALCARVDFPVNILMLDGAPPVARLAELGVGRVSFGPLPYVRCMHHLQTQATSVQT